MPSRGGDDSLIKEPETLSISVPEHVPVFTVTLKRCDIVSLQRRTTIRTPGDAAAILRDRLYDEDAEHYFVAQHSQSY
jgi:hypothetical protein